MLSIVMPIRFRPDLTKVCLDSLFSYTKDFELILVQEGDEPGISELVKEYNTKVILINKEPLGYVKAINKGLREISEHSDYVMLLNSDVVCTPNWADELIKVLDSDPTIGMAVPLLSEQEGPQNISRAGEKNNYFIVDDIKGVCILLKRKVYNQLLEHSKEHRVQGDQLLDERFELGGGDDNDLSLRVRLLGYKIVVVRKSFLYHYSSASFRELFDHDVPYSKKYSSRMFNKFKEKWRDKLNDKPSVYLAIPTVDSTIDYQLAQLLVYWSHCPDIKLNLKVWDGLWPMDNARNTIVKDFLEGYDDFLWWVDDDIIPPSETFMRMVKILEENSNIDALGAVCFSMKQDRSEYFPYPVTLRLNEENKYEVYYGNGIEWVDAVGGACVMVKRRVYEALERPYEFVYHRDGTLALTCDFEIWRRAKEKGFNLYVDFNILCDHRKTCSIKGIQDTMSNLLGGNS